MEHTVEVVVVVASEELAFVKLVEVIGRDIVVVAGGSVEEDTELGEEGKNSISFAWEAVSWRSWNSCLCSQGSLVLGCSLSVKHLPGWTTTTLTRRSRLVVVMMLRLDRNCTSNIFHDQLETKLEKWCSIIHSELK